MSNKPGFFRQLKDTQNYSTKFLIVLFSPNSGVTPYYSFGFCRHTKKSNAIQVGFFWVAVGGQGGFAPLQAR